MGGAWVHASAKLAVVLGFVLALASAGAGALPLSRCTTTNARDRSLCGHVTVPLDRVGSLPGTIDLRVGVLAPKHANPTGAVLALAGGPGQAGVDLLNQMAGALGPALDTRELIAFDQRGTGDSGRLTCPTAFAHAHSQSALVSQCASELGAGRVAYTTAESVQDAEAVRAAFGVDRLILYGTSYGTKVALAYAAAYPQHVERLVLDSVVMPEGIDPFERTTLASIPRMLRTLCAGSCRFTHDPVADLAAFVRRLASRPLRGHALDAAGRSRPVSLTRADLLGMIIAGDLDPALRAALPAAVHAALSGDSAPLLRLASDDGDGGSTGDSDALYLATTCEDGGVPWAPGTPLQARRAAVDAAAAALPAAAFAPFDRGTVRAVGTADLCRAWPESPIVQPQPPLPATPTLILSGDDDVRTPRANALALAARLPDARVFEVPDAGHSVLGEDPTNCTESAVRAFLAGQLPGACRPHRRAVPTLALAPRALRDVHGVGKLPSRSARTVGALTLTLGDVVDQLIEQAISSGGSSAPPAFGGLRAGSARVDPSHGVRLRGYAYVPGVTVTGLLANRGASTVTLAGSAGAHGRLTISKQGIAGTLDGRRVRVTAGTLGHTTASAASAAVRRSGGGPALRLPPALRGLAAR